MATSRLRRGVGDARTATACRRGLAPRAGGALVVLGCVALTACGPAGADAEGPRARAAVLYVSNARDGTVTRIDAAAGRVMGPPQPAGAAPWHLAVGPSGELLVQSAAVGPAAGVTYVAQAASGWQARPLSLEPGARDPLLAGGGRYAAVAYRAAGGRCRVVRVDLEQGQPGAAHEACAGRDAVVGLAASADGMLAYLALWRRPAAAQPCAGPTGSRVVALRLDTGALVAIAPLDGVPGPLVLASGPGGRGERLYVTEALPGPAVAAPGGLPEACAAASGGEAFEGARAWRVWGLDATTLAPEAEYAVPSLPRALAVTPDGDAAFVLAGRAALLRLDPAGGPARLFATLPDQAFGLAATDHQVFTLDVFGDRLWSLDRTRGRGLRTIPTGRRPLGLALAAAGRS